MKAIKMTLDRKGPWPEPTGHVRNSWHPSRLLRMRRGHRPRLTTKVANPPLKG